MRFQTLAILTFAAGMATAQQQPRDLKYESGAAESQNRRRGHSALLRAGGGIATYKNLAAKISCQLSSATPKSMYSILISPEGGNFHAENVHKLVGARATLANLRHELEEWLPAAAQADDRALLVYFAGHGFISGGRA